MQNLEWEIEYSEAVTPDAAYYCLERLHQAPVLSRTYLEVTRQECLWKVLVHNLVAKLVKCIASLAEVLPHLMLMQNGQQSMQCNYSVARRAAR